MLVAIKVCYKTITIKVLLLPHLVQRSFLIFTLLKHYFLNNFTRLVALEFFQQCFSTNQISSVNFPPLMLMLNKTPEIWLPVKKKITS